MPAVYAAHGCPSASAMQQLAELFEFVPGVGLEPASKHHQHTSDTLQGEVQAKDQPKWRAVGPKHPKNVSAGRLWRLQSRKRRVRIVCDLWGGLRTGWPFLPGFAFCAPPARTGLLCSPYSATGALRDVLQPLKQPAVTGSSSGGQASLAKFHENIGAAWKSSTLCAARSQAVS